MSKEAPLACLVYPKSPLIFGREVETNGDMAFLVECASILSEAIGMCELELLVARYAEESGLTVWCELLLRSCGICGTGSSSRKLLEKVAFDAVIGVPGEALWPFFGGGVMEPKLVAPAPSYSAAILAAVGVLSGRRFSGGIRRGCKVLRLMLMAPLAFFSVLGRSTLVRPLPCCPMSGFETSLSPWPDNSPSVLEPPFALLVSKGKLDLRAEKNGWSNSVLGDSYALGIAGTGGTSSSLAAGTLSILVFRVGNLEFEKLWDMRAEPVEFTNEL